MTVRVIDKQVLTALVSNYNWGPIPREVVDHWVKMYGKDITIESEKTESSHTPRAEENKSKESACAQNEPKEQENNDNKVQEEYQSLPLSNLKFSEIYDIIYIESGKRGTKNV